MIQIDWAAFSPVSALLGGALIGVAVIVLMVTQGRIAGISGIVSGLLHRAPGDVLWRAAFVIGILLAPTVYAQFVLLPAAEVTTSWPLLVLAGLLVGFGTRMGAGCTSGHGVCGLSRLSPRSMLATASFMAAGFVTVYVVRHLIA